MKVFFNESSYKTENLISGLKNSIDARKKHHFTIFTCYLSENLKDLKNFFDKISGEIRITGISLHIDSRQCIKSGICKLQSFQEKFNKNYGEDFLNIYAIDTPKIFHSKAYILQSEDELSGAIALGSANFSKSGLFANKNGNFESLIINNDQDLINDFLNIEKINKYIKELHQLEEFKTENYAFKLAILEEGRFVRKWSGSINQYFTTKFTLTEKGKEQIQGGILSNLGFEIDAETISKQFINFSEINTNYHDNFQRLLGKGLETSAGYWLPNKLLWDLLDDKLIHNFYDIIKDLVKKQTTGIKDELTRVYEQLLAEEYITAGTPPIQMIDEKLEQLKEDNIRLERFYHRYSVIDLPYDFSTHKEEIEDLYDELVEVSKNKKRANLSSKLVLKAINRLNPNLINYDEITDADEE
mgnify:FL=1